MAGSLSPLERHRSPSPRSDFLAIPEFGSPHLNCASSPTSLNVPGSWFGLGGLGGGSWDGRRRTSSAASSIFDLSAECENLERALKSNDVGTVRKYLQLHHNRFPLDVHASFLDKSSCDSHSRRHSHVSQDVDILLRKSQTLIDSLERHRDSEVTEDGPNIFRCSLHVAMQNNSLDVMKVLLKYGVDPNEPQGISGMSKSRRSSYQSICGTDSSSPVAGLGISHSQAMSPCEHLDQRLSPSPTLVIQGPDSPKLSKLEVEERSGSKTPEEPRKSVEFSHVRRSFCSVDQNQYLISSHSRQQLSNSQGTGVKFGHHACKSNQSQSCHHNQLQQNNPISAPASMSSSHSTLRTGGSSSLKSKNLEPPCRSPANRRANSPVCQLPEIVETVVEENFQYGTHYTKEELLNLPCLYLAIVEGNPYFVQLLLRYGAMPNVQDLYGCSPLHLACCPDFHNIEIIRILLRYGAKVYLKNALADSPYILWPGVLEEQKVVIQTALTKIPTYPLGNKSRSRTPSGPCHQSKDSPPMLTPVQDSVTNGVSNRSGSVSRFFKRLSSDPKSRPSKERKILIREESSVFYSEAGRDRTYSSGSHKSLKSRHMSSYVQDDMDSEISLTFSYRSKDKRTSLQVQPPQTISASTGNPTRVACTWLTEGDWQGRLAVVSLN